ncbi:hypothetical protein Hanom_Chr12g01161001 [Helianthus anomalus]
MMMCRPHLKYGCCNGLLVRFQESNSFWRFALYKVWAPCQETLCLWININSCNLQK